MKESQCISFDTNRKNQVSSMDMWLLWLPGHGWRLQLVSFLNLAYHHCNYYSIYQGIWLILSGGRHHLLVQSWRQLQDWEISLVTYCIISILAWIYPRLILLLAVCFHLCSAGTSTLWFSVELGSNAPEAALNPYLHESFEYSALK